MGSKTIGAMSEEDNSVESRLSFWLSWAVLLTGIGSGIASAYLVVTTYSPVPHWDEWALFYDLANGVKSLGWLWQQHNEHRILTTRLLFLLDVELFHGTQIFLLAAIFLTQLLQVGLLELELAQTRRGARFRVEGWHRSDRILHSLPYAVRESGLGIPGAIRFAGGDGDAGLSIAGALLA